MKKFFSVLIVAVVVVFTLVPMCAAYSASTYSDLAQSSTNANNLIAYASNFDTFEGSEYVVAQVGQYDFRIFWGDLFVSNGSVVSDYEVEYVQYVREGSGYDYSYSYYVGSDSSLTLSVDHLVVSNIAEVGMRSALYEDFNFYDLFDGFLILVIALLFVSVVVALRMCFK